MDQHQKHRFRADVALFLVQIFLVVIVVCVSITYLSLGVSNPNFMTVLLTSCLGYIMPNPKIKITENTFVSGDEQRFVNEVVSESPDIVASDLKLQKIKKKTIFT